ncbi:MAG TPA: M28 family peptidase, partial [Bacteroidales bacterium]
EAARLLSGIEFPYSIIYALWDEEEIGLIGSRYYAEKANMLGMNIDGVINIDMIGWDGNDDGLIELHTKFENNSVPLAAFISNINPVYSINLSPSIQNPGTTYSDHSSFWDNGFSAVLLIEGYYTNDFNPYYHSVNDRISKFNLPYFHKCAKLAIGSLSSLAMVNITGLENYFGTSEDISAIANHPNPFSNETKIEISLANESVAHVFVVNNLGQKVKEIFRGNLEKGSHSLSMNSNNLQDGIYFLVLQTEKERVTSKMIISR